MSDRREERCVLCAVADRAYSEGAKREPDRAKRRKKLRQAKRMRRRMVRPADHAAPN